MHRRSSSLREGASTHIWAPQHSLYAFLLLISLGALPVSINSSADGAVSPQDLDNIRAKLVDFDLDKCAIQCDLKEAKGKFLIDHVPTELTIATSSRPYHMIVSYATQITLRDCYKINDVQVRPIDPEINQFDQDQILTWVWCADIDDVTSNINGPLGTELPHTKARPWPDRVYLKTATIYMKKSYLKIFTI